MLVNSSITGHRLVSLPFSDFCEPLINNEEDFDLLISSIISHCQTTNIMNVEIRGGKEYFVKESESYSYHEHILELNKSEEELFGSFNESTRRNIKKAIKNGVQIDFMNDLNSINEFYHLNCITRKKHGLPPQPFSFFKNLFNSLIEKEMGFVLSAKYNNDIIASSILLNFGNKSYYKFGASDEKFQNIRPNNLIMWEAIKHFKNSGFTSFNFGRTEKENAGLRRFKLGWGTDEKVINTYIYSLKQKEFIKKGTHTSGFHNKIFNKTPLPLLKMFGSIFYRHFG